MSAPKFHLKASGIADLHALCGRPVGALAETCPRGLHPTIENSGTYLVSNRVELTAIPLIAGVTYSTAHVLCGSVATGTLTAQYFGLFDVNLDRKAVTGNGGSAAWVNQDYRSMNFTSAYVPTYTGYHYLAVLVVGTVPSVYMRPAPSFYMGGGAGQAFPRMHFSSNTGVTTIPTSISIQNERIDMLVAHLS